MKSKEWLLVAFLVVSAGNLLAVGAGWKGLEYLTKPLLMATLSGWVWDKVKHKPGFAKWVVAGLLFSLLGDTLLMLVGKFGELFFMAGLLAFLTAHIFYMTAFVKYPRFRSGLVFQKNWLLLPLLAFLASFVGYLLPNLAGILRVAVPIYATFITGMALAGINMGLRAERPASTLITAGVLLFMLSDSLIALTKFQFPDWKGNVAGLAIMVTYLLGQYLIARGSVQAHATVSIGELQPSQ